ncbi:hypothetical protein MJO28_013503 [Puccinia striiformis f. sp. tritici]|uniref:Uncharacterized protein n=1 Tax=Puccinia striiformis f. sp. tritici TaxID=168172 RepID=A0ACC0DZZ9_9BASI|nr:hypothetical protein MJO28_013503 [Puccinia striiformis f. sp. tritici]
MFNAWSLVPLHQKTGPGPGLESLIAHCEIIVVRLFCHLRDSRVGVGVCPFESMHWLMTSGTHDQNTGSASNRKLRDLGFGASAPRGEGAICDVLSQLCSAPAPLSSQHKNCGSNCEAEPLAHITVQLAPLQPTSHPQLSTRTATSLLTLLYPTDFALSSHTS